MQKKLPKFLLAHNHHAGASENYIVHTQKPNFISQVHHFQNQKEVEIFLLGTNDLFYKNERYNIVITFISEFYAVNGINSKTSETLERALNWYIQTQVLRPKKIGSH